MIITSRQLAELREKNPEKKIVFFDGVFDLLHVGHIEALKDLRKYGDMIVVGVLSDERVKSTKGELRPIMGEQERLRLIDSVRYVDYALLLQNPENKIRIRTSEAIQLLHPDVFVSVDPTWQDRFAALGNTNTSFELIERVSTDITTTTFPISTSALIERIISIFGSRK